MNASEVVTTYVDILRLVIGTLREHFVRVERAGSPGILVAKLDSGELRREGMIEGLGNYWFHGRGILVEMSSGALVDFDWDSDGNVVFDSWRIRKYAQSLGLEGGDEAEYLAECEELVEQGSLFPACARGWFGIN